MPNSFQKTVRSTIAEIIRGINGQKREEPITPIAKGSEADYQHRLAAKLGGEMEVYTPVGKIDILTKTEVIEVKVAKNWKSALGQVKSYGKFYPNHRLRIHLFGKLTPSALENIQSICQQENVILTYE
jgi:predicted house-cleaning noncanonical NTP pyrophosphatase (MazG superfamily)